MDCRLRLPRGERLPLKGRAWRCRKCRAVEQAWRRAVVIDRVLAEEPELVDDGRRWRPIYRQASPRS